MLTLLEKWFRTRTSWPAVSSLCQCWALLFAGIAGGLLPGPLPSLKNRKPCAQQDWGEAGIMSIGQMPLAHASSCCLVSSLGFVPSSGIRWPHLLPGHCWLRVHRVLRVNQYTFFYTREDKYPKERQRLQGGQSPGCMLFLRAVVCTRQSRIPVRRWLPHTQSFKD